MFIPLNVQAKKNHEQPQQAQQPQPNPSKQEKFNSANYSDTDDQTPILSDTKRNIKNLLDGKIVGKVGNVKSIKVCECKFPNFKLIRLIN